MSLNFWALLLCVGDVVSVLVLSASMRELQPKLIDSTFAVARLCICAIFVLLSSDVSRARLLAASAVALSVIPSLVELYRSSDEHAKADFFIALCFGTCEAALLVLNRSISMKATTKNASVPLHEPLLQDIENGVSSIATLAEEVEVDTYKGQGATFARLLSLAYPERYILFIASLALFISSAATVVTPALFGRLIETISVTKDEDDLNKTTLLLVLMFVISSIFALIRGALFTLAGERLVARFRVRLFDAILHQDIEFFDKNQSGELQSRLASDTASIQNAVTVNVSMSLRWFVQAIVSLVIIFVISWQLTLVMLAVVPVIGIGARIYGSFVRDLSKQYQDALAKSSETAEEAMGNIRTVRSFSKESYEVNRYRERVQTSYEQGKKRAWAYGIFIGVVGLAGYLAVTLVLWRGGMMVIRDSDGLSSADLTSFLLYTLNLAVSLGGLSELYSTLISAMGASDRMFKILDTDPKINNRGPIATSSLVKTRKRSGVGSTVEFKNVEFSYPTRPDVKVLQSISFTCAAGTVNAFCGASGQGKSTLISLIQRFYDPASGTISINGEDLRGIDPVQLHEKMAVVSQEPTLFACSIAENIAYGLKRTPTEAEIIEAAKKANAYDFIMSFKPSGFSTLVGERGVQLSGGQKQRIAIARAILVDPEILLLDEATSALDTQSEHLVQTALDELMQGRTTIIVAHRLSTVRHASSIFVIDHGVVAESGTYEDLSSRQGGLFNALVSRQLSH